MKRADPTIEDKKGRIPLQYAKEKIKDKEWLPSVVNLLEDAMDVNVSLW